MGSYPIYRTKNGTPIAAYLAEAIGKYFSIDGGENNYRGTHGVIGSFVTAEEAIAAAQREANETCIVRVLDTRTDDDARFIIFEQ